MFYFKVCMRVLSSLLTQLLDEEELITELLLDLEETELRLEDTELLLEDTELRFELALLELVPSPFLNTLLNARTVIFAKFSVLCSWSRLFTYFFISAVGERFCLSFSNSFCLSFANSFLRTSLTAPFSNY